MEGYPKRKRGDPTWSAARDDAYAQKERPGGEPYRLSPSGDSALPKATTNYPRRVGVLIMPLQKAPPRRRRDETKAWFLSAIPPAHFIRHLPLHKGGFRRQATTNPAPKFFYYFFHRKAVPPLFAGDAKREKAPPAWYRKRLFPISWEGVLCYSQ